MDAKYKNCVRANETRDHGWQKYTYNTNKIGAISFTLLPKSNKA